LLQAQYTGYRKVYEGVEDVKIYIQLEMAGGFLNTVAFNQSHWLFAFKYWEISWRMELLKMGMSPNIYNTRL